MPQRSTQSAPPGLGLGLSICKRICNALAGDIRVLSSRSKKDGTTFEFFIGFLRFDSYGDESDGTSLAAMSNRSSTHSQAFLMRRERHKVRTGKSYQSDDSSF